MHENFDIKSNFYESTALRKLIFKEEAKKKIPSSVMWALYMYAHPSSEIYNFPASAKLDIIKSSYLRDPSFEIETYEDTLRKIQKSLPKYTRMLVEWETKLEELDEYISKLTFENDAKLLIDLMKSKKQLWQQYHEILTLFEKHNSTSQGDIEESVTEQGLI